MALDIRRRPGSATLSPNNPQLQNQQYPLCCGIYTLYSLDSYIHSQYTTRFKDQEEGCKLLTEYLNHVKKNIHMAQASMATVALNFTQNEILADAIKAAGWKCIINGAHNGRHNSRIYLYAWVFRPELSDPNVYGGADALDY